MKIPILFLIFNRPDTTQKVFNEIKKIKPEKLYVAADGARQDVPGESEKCHQARSIIQQVDWPCEVKTLFREQNAGCKYAVSSGIGWFFQQEESGIILEDDCLPNLTFFQFCEELLEKYKYDEHIMMIGGTNFQLGKKFNPESYYFSKYCHVWGWASWKRAWQKYDLEMKRYPEFLAQKKINALCVHSSEQSYWNSIFDAVYNGKIDTWDYQWVFSIWNEGAVSIIPNVNLISNIGCDQGTHTSAGGDERVNRMSTVDILFPMKHPVDIKQNVAADNHYYNNFIKKSFQKKVYETLHHLVGRLTDRINS